MAFQFTCPHCGTETKVEDHFEGQRGPCAVCGKVVNVDRPAPENQIHSPNPPSSSSSAGLVALFFLALGVIAFLILFVVGLVFMAIPATQMVTTTGSRNVCTANLQRIGQAMLTYEQEHGTFPPAFIKGDDGTPAHSWRVMLLPYLGEADLYKNYKMSERFDGGQNVWLASQMPSVYACPDDVNSPVAETSYMVVHGEGMVFNGDQSCSLADITDGPANTILVIETVASAVSWLEPVDLDSRSMSLSINAGGANEIASMHQGGANVLFADGHVEFLPDLTSPAKLQALLSIDASDNPQ